MNLNTAQWSRSGVLDARSDQTDLVSVIITEQASSDSEA